MIKKKETEIPAESENISENSEKAELPAENENSEVQITEISNAEDAPKTNEDVPTAQPENVPKEKAEKPAEKQGNHHKKKRKKKK